MGLTTVNLQIRSLKDPKKTVESEFLVDSGAFYTVLPRNLVKKLALKPDGVREFSLADARKIKRYISNALIKLEGEEIAVPVILGEKDDTALLGVQALEAMGLILDPFSRKLYPAKLTL
ncbi:MAG: retroviral-like aspartic protease family protein [Patescibacteria group bacterium]